MYRCRENTYRRVGVKFYLFAESVQKRINRCGKGIKPLNVFEILQFFELYVLRDLV